VYCQTNSLAYLLTRLPCPDMGGDGLLSSLTRLTRLSLPWTLLYQLMTDWPILLCVRYTIGSTAQCALLGPYLLDEGRYDKTACVAQ
jgi:hypothetical protein